MPSITMNSPKSKSSVSRSISTNARAKGERLRSQKDARTSPITAKSTHDSPLRMP